MYNITYITGYNIVIHNFEGYIVYSYYKALVSLPVLCISTL